MGIPGIETGPRRPENYKKSPGVISNRDPRIPNIKDVISEPSEGHKEPQAGNHFDSALPGSSGDQQHHHHHHQHTHDRHRSHGVMDHLLGRSRAPDDTSGIIGSRRERASLSGTQSAGPGEILEVDGQSYTFDIPRASKEDPRRSAVDAVPRASALDSEGAVSHEFSTRGAVTEKDDGRLSKESSASRQLTDSGLY
ncbi:hypothetical protein PG994_002553 [Apiospora phragmitis]|uniref:Uncharacterized protein n=1 Tax=Apiospora phragmitis TaxID=2905665 RepID=A0ABR1W5H8_9PEZI